jgi:hypothetical protein
VAYIGAVVTKDSDIKRITFATTTTGSGPFAIGWSPDSEASLRVTINGVTQQGSDITVSGSNLTIAETLISGDELEVVGIQSVGSAMVPQDGSVSIAKMTRAGTTNHVLHSQGTGSDAVWKLPAIIKYAERGSTSGPQSQVSVSEMADCNHLIILLDSTTNSINFGLPTAAQLEGKLVTCAVGIYSDTVTINEGDESTTFVTLTAVSDFVTVTSNGTNYIKLGVRISAVL